jgi:hypothetical protein
VRPLVSFGRSRREGQQRRLPSVRALKQLGQIKGLIIDVRGNSGGGFDADRAFRNFDPDDNTEPSRPRFTGPIALLLDERTVSAGDCVVIPPGVEHKLTNTGDVPIRLLCCCAPAYSHEDTVLTEPEL